MIEHGMCRSYKNEILRGIHSDEDTYYLALYDGDANIGPQTQRYTSNGEVKGGGYRPGGKQVKLRVVPDEYGAAIWVENVVWETTSIAARGCLLYNATKGSRAVAVFSFGDEISSVNGNFTVVMDSGQLIRIA